MQCMDTTMGGRRSERRWRTDFRAETTGGEPWACATGSVADERIVTTGVADTSRCAADFFLSLYDFIEHEEDRGVSDVAPCVGASALVQGTVKYLEARAEFVEARLAQFVMQRDVGREASPGTESACS
jgi:hypothetical protein